jgi:hypothetical protein
MSQVNKKSQGHFLKADLDALLLEGEHIVESAHISPFIYWQTFCVFILAIVVGLIAAPLGWLLVVTATLMFIYNALRKKILLLVLTNKRMFMRYGILQIDVVDMRFSKIESIEIERMPTGYIMGYSNLVIMGTGQRYITIPYVSNGPEIRQAYNRLTLDKDEDAG